MDGLIQWSPGVTLEAVEKQIIQIAYRHYRGNKTATANSLGIAVRTLDYKLAQYDTDIQSEKERYDNERSKREEFLARSRGTPTDHVFTNSGAPVSSARDSSSERVRLEPTSQSPSQPPVSVSQRKEVQGVLPSQTPKSGAQSRR